MGSEKHILILSFSDLGRDPRVARQIEWLRGSYRVTAAGFGDPRTDGIRYLALEGRARPGLGRSLRRALAWAGKRFERLYWSGWRAQNALQALMDERGDLVVANDVETLPLALRLAERTGAKVLLDAHEYAPRRIEDRWTFRLFWQRYWDFICRQYLRRVDGMVTVSQGIADEYERNYGVACRVVTNAPVYQELTPAPVRDDRIRLVHHGVVTPSRHIENMILLTDLLDERFTLDLMLLATKRRCLHRLQRLVRKRPRVRFRSPVPMAEVPRALNRYDIGLALFPPVNFNLLMVLPNKLFEFIQGRLGVAIWPSPEMARVVTDHGCGIVGEDFTRHSMAEALNRLTPGDIRHFKERAHQTASVLSAEANRDILVGLVRELIGP